MATLSLYPQPARRTRARNETWTEASRPAFERVASLESAVSAIERWGAVLLLPAPGLPLPSLWELWRGRRGLLATLEWAEIAEVYGWKGTICAERRALFGRWCDGRPAFLARDLVAPARALACRARSATGAKAPDRVVDAPPVRTRRGGGGLQCADAPDRNVVDRAGPADRDGAPDHIEGTARRLLDTLRRCGPLPATGLRRAAGLAGRSAGERFQAALEVLEARFEVAVMGSAAEGDAWPSDVYATVDAAFPELATLPVEPARAAHAVVERAAALAAWDPAAPATLSRLLGADPAVEPAEPAAAGRPNQGPRG